MHALALLQVGNHVKEVPGLRVAFRTQHPHQTFRVLPGQRAECLKANRSVDVTLQRHFLLTSTALPLATACGLRPSPFYLLRLP